MIKNSDYLTFYVNHSWGGAYNAMVLASKKNKEYINLGSKEIKF